MLLRGNYRKHGFHDCGLDCFQNNTNITHKAVLNTEHHGSDFLMFYSLLFMDKRDWSDNFHCCDSSHLQREFSTNIPSARGGRASLSTFHTHLELSHDHKYRLDVDIFVSCFCFQEIILLFPSPSLLFWVFLSLLGTMLVFFRLDLRWSVAPH